MENTANTRQRARAALALFLTSLHPEAPHRIISAVSSVSELSLAQMLEQDNTGALAAFSRLTLPQAQQELSDRLQKICNPETPAPVVSVQLIQLITLLAAWQSGVVEAYSRQAAGEEPTAVLGS